MTGDEFRVAADVIVRWRDTDALGHVNNSVYLSYLEMARWKYWTGLTGARTWKDVNFILARAEIDYRSPSTVGEELQVWLRISKLARSSFVFDYRIKDKATGRLVAEARTTQAFYDYQRNKVIRIDEGLRRKIVDFEGLAPAHYP